MHNKEQKIFPAKRTWLDKFGEAGAILILAYLWYMGLEAFFNI